MFTDFSCLQKPNWNMCFDGFKTWIKRDQRLHSYIVAIVISRALTVRVGIWTNCTLWYQALWLFPVRDWIVDWNLSIRNATIELLTRVNLYVSFLALIVMSRSSDAVNPVSKMSCLSHSIRWELHWAFQFSVVNCLLVCLLMYESIYCSIC